MNGPKDYIVCSGCSVDDTGVVVLRRKLGYILGCGAEQEIIRLDQYQR